MPTGSWKAGEWSFPNIPRKNSNWVLTRQVDGPTIRIPKAETPRETL